MVLCVLLEEDGVFALVLPNAEFLVGRFGLAGGLDWPSVGFWFEAEP